MEENETDSSANTDTKRRSSLEIHKKVQVKKNTSELIIMSFVIGVSAFFMLQTVLDWFSDIYTFGKHLKNKNYGYAFLTILFVLIAGIICSIRFSSLETKYKNYPDYIYVYEKVEIFLSYLYKVPSVQPIIFSFYVFAAGLKLYPLHISFFPKSKDLINFSNRLSIYEGIFEAAPQSILQIYIYVSQLEEPFSSVYSYSVEDYITVASIILSILSMSLTGVKYWMTTIPYTLEFYINPYDKTDLSMSKKILKFWTKISTLFVYLPYHIEAFTFIALRATLIPFAIIHISSIFSRQIDKKESEADLVLLKSFLILTIGLMTPRLAYIFCSFSRINHQRIFSNIKELNQVLIKSNSDRTLKFNRRELYAKYFIKYLKRGVFSIFLYPIHPFSFFLTIYSNLENILVIYLNYSSQNVSYLSFYSYYHIYLLTLYILIFTLRICWEYFFLNRKNSVATSGIRTGYQIKNALVNFENSNESCVVKFNKFCLDIEDFMEKLSKENYYYKRLSKNSLKNIFTPIYNHKSLTSPILIDYGVKISEDGQKLVLKNVPICKYIQYIFHLYLCQMAVSYEEVYRKFQTFKQFFSFKKVKLSSDQFTHEDRDILLNTPKAVMQLEKFYIINFFSSLPYWYNEAHNFTKFEIEANVSFLRPFDIHKLLYISKLSEVDLEHVENLRDYLSFSDESSKNEENCLGISEYFKISYIDDDENDIEEEGNNKDFITVDAISIDSDSFSL